MPSNIFLPPVFQDIHNLKRLPYDLGVYKTVSSFPYFEVPSKLIIDVELPSAPETMKVYRIVSPEIDYAKASEIAKRFGLTGETKQTTHGDLTRYYFANTIGDGWEALYVMCDGRIDYYNGDARIDKPVIPDREECIQIAREWLKKLSLYPNNVLRVEVLYDIAYFDGPTLWGSWSYKNVVHSGRV